MRLLLFALLLFAALWHAPALAQSEAEDRSYFLGLVESQLSGPNRQIRISGIEGVLSSNATIRSITVSDNEGVWLSINNARIVWDRSALLFGRLEIETLAADSIDVYRLPGTDETVTPEAEPFQLPELPLSITLDRLEVPRVYFGPTVFGLESVLNVAGELSLVEGALDTALAVTRLDGPGGALRLAASYSNETEVLSVDLNLSEPENGVVANLLNIEGRPPITLALNGTGPLSRFDAQLALDAAGARAVSGTAQVRRDAAAYGFTVDVRGDVARLIAPRFRPFFGEEVTLSAEGAVPDVGGFTLERLALDGRALDVDLALGTAPDGFLRRLALDARLGTGDGAPTVLPVPGGNTTVRSARAEVNFGEGGEWTGRIEAADFATPAFSAQSFGITLGGVAENLNDPAARRITFNASGGALGVEASQPEVTEALGNRILLNVEGEWRSGQPIRLSRAELSAQALELALAGEIAENTFAGTIEVDASSIAPFSALAGRDLNGRLALDTEGTVGLLSGAFDLALDGSATGLELGTPALDRLLAGETTLSGRVARGEEGFRAERLTLSNPQLTLTADGAFSTGAADFDFSAELADLALLSDRASGRLTLSGRAEGQNDNIGITLNAVVPEGALVGRPLQDAQAQFAGSLTKGNLEGRLTAEARLAEQPVSLSTTLAVSGGERRLSDLDFRAGGTALTGFVVQNPAGLFSGNLNLSSSDISTAAALFLVEASGAAVAEVTLGAVEGRQDARVEASLSNIRVNDIRIGGAEVEADVTDLLGVPTVEGTVSATAVEAGGVSVATLEASATATGGRTEFSAEARLANGADIGLAGSLEPEGQGFRLGLTEARLALGELAARLLEPTSLTVEGSTIRLPGLALEVGGGRIEAQGTIAETLDVALSLDEVPLDIANAVRPDLELSGLVSGSARVSGTRAEPQIEFDLSAPAIRAAALSRAGIGSLAISAEGRTAGNRLDLNASLSSPEGLRATVAGALPLDEGELALDVNLEAFPLAIANAVVPELELAGTLAGTARLTGTYAEPEAIFDLRGTGLSAAPLARAGVPPLTVVATGSFVDQLLTLERATIEGPGGLRASAQGRIPLTGGELALDVDLESLPLAIANAVRPELELAGTLSGTAQLSGTLADPSARFDLRGANLSAAPLARAGVPPLSATARGSFADQVLTLEQGVVEGAGGLRAAVQGRIPLEGGDLALDVSLEAFPLTTAGAFFPELELAGTLSGTAQVGGTLANPTATFDLRGAGLTAGVLARASVPPLSAMAAGRFADRVLTLDQVIVEGAGGLRLVAEGVVPLEGGPIDLDVSLESFPLSVANAFVPGQDLSGAITGSAQIGGTLDSPTASFDLAGANLSAAPLASVGVPPLTLSARGRFANDVLTLDAAFVTGGGLAITAEGTVPVTGGPIALDVTLQSFPLGILNGVAPNQALAGTITGTARVSGTLAAPQASFDLRGAGLSAAPLARAGVAPLTLSASGRFADDAIVLEAASLQSAAGLTLTASGRLPIRGAGADLSIDGSVPLGLANGFLAERGAQASGTLEVRATVMGSLADPDLRGMFSTAGASFVDPQTNVRLTGINLMGSLDGDAITIRSASAAVAGGGTISASGTIGLSGDLPADIGVTLSSARYADGDLLVATVSGNVRVSGALRRDPLVSGTLDVERAQITVPSTFGGRAPNIEVTHINPPPGVRATLERARVAVRADDGTPAPTARPSVVRLDIQLNAPNEVFVRGRGLDAELGGSVRLTGPISSIEPVGGFRLIRGRLDILGQRITFDEGTVTLVGDLDPFLDFTASTESEGVTAFIILRGRVSDLDISFSSDPPLPEDEVLARIIFGRSIDELSPLQIAQLAAAAAELAGGGNTSLLGSLREATGLDDLDVVTDEEGNAAVRAGRYVQENVYLGVEAGAGGGRATINLDITDNLRVRGAVGTDSSLGVFYERDY
ncbi:MAG TPA: translocation/assembly module TamB domain-containing protein [Mesorhizobium sp.]|jgi:translocation and assembly module TamB|nr:translocation/assembly module TamB domain-containing protein [Mesorhizobium sp.]